MSKTVIHTESAPAAVGPYSQAVRSGDLLFCSGSIGLDPRTGALVEGGVAAETRRALDNLGEVLSAAGAHFDDIVKTTIYLIDMGDFETVNAIYAERFDLESAPARATVAVAALPKGATVEIEAIARLETP
ncbi:MAG: RidA family protein [Myxococcota bacterium]